MALRFVLRLGLCFVIVISLFSYSCVMGEIDGKTLTLGNEGGGRVTAPYFFAVNDAAGYSDWIWYGRSFEHEFSYHEILSGEWAAAIYYDGLDTERVDPNDPGSCRAISVDTGLFL